MAPYPEGSPRYTSYLLRLRWVERDEQQICQAMLTSVATKEQRHFADLESLMAFLQAQGPQFEAAPAQVQLESELVSASDQPHVLPPKGTNDERDQSKQTK